MTDTPRTPRPRATLPAFTPVPRERERHDGWTPERQRGFIAALADTGSVKAAAHAVNMTPEGAYVLRRHARGASFRKAWEAALALGVQRLEDVAMERALHGIEVPVYSYGQLIGTRRVYNDRLLMFLLRNRAAKRFTEGRGGGLNAASRSHLQRMKREWRKEWEKEREAEIAAQATRSPEQIHALLSKRIDAAHHDWVSRMSPETLRYYAAFRTAKRAQAAGTSLEALGLDPFAEDFDPQTPLLPAPDESAREQIREMG
ncbi:hypothetical protein ABVV53_13955 [Novosphingobium sp. RD2P27]|uniref:Uncharacterized protein n=1 Tax=Novosphingobium kalidii TaxID=3230299 RepID=A0ABV2D3V4_9SPHN